MSDETQNFDKFDLSKFMNRAAEVLGHTLDREIAQMLCQPKTMPTEFQHGNIDAMSQDKSYATQIVTYTPTTGWTWSSTASAIGGPMCGVRRHEISPPSDTRVAPQCCDQEARWVVNGMNERLSYWYCDGCKREPKALPSRPKAAAWAYPIGQLFQGQRLVCQACLGLVATANKSIDLYTGGLHTDNFDWWEGMEVKEGELWLSRCCDSNILLWQD
jgi:hypothetical protein